MPYPIHWSKSNYFERKKEVNFDEEINILIAKLTELIHDKRVSDMLKEHGLAEKDKIWEKLHAVVDQYKI